MLRTIHQTFAPMADRTQVRLALRWLLRPRRWKGRGQREALRTALSQAFHGDVFLFASGREALLAFFQSDSDRFCAGDEIIVQGYTCVVVPNALQAAGLLPVYADIEKATLSMDPADVERLITPKTKAILCQHTFGLPAPTSDLRDICDRHGLLLIEDCAHILPDETGPNDIGRLGDVLLLSFGRDKAISGITGGAVVLKPRNNEITNQRLHEYAQKASDLPHGIILRLLFYPVIYSLARPMYGAGLGKAILVFARAAKLLLPIVTQSEKNGHPSSTLHQMPEPCAALALLQFRKLRRINDHRRKLTAIYLQACADHGWPVLHGIRSDLPLQKFPMFARDAENIRKKLKRQNIHLHDGWTGCVVCPADVQIDDVGYRSGLDSKAEEACEEILTLPTHPLTTVADAQRVIEALEAAGNVRA